MMNYDEFKEYMADHIRDYLPEEYNYSVVELMDILKTNDLVRSAIRITKEDSSIAPTIYLDDFYAKYMEGTSIDSLLNQLAHLRVEVEAKNLINVDRLSDLNQVKDKIQCKLIGFEANEEYLKDKPYMLKEDLAVVYTIDVDSNERGKMATVITNSLMNALGIGKEELHSIALNNLENVPPKFGTMRDILMEQMFPDGIDSNDPMIEFMPPEEEHPSMYVLTNNESLNGAAEILNEKLMKSIAEEIGGDFIVLPSSIHEVIIVPADLGMERAELEAMIQEVNETQVRPEERLSDKPYQYDSKTHELMRMDKMEQMRKIFGEGQQKQRPCIDEGKTYGEKAGSGENGEGKRAGKPKAKKNGDSSGVNFKDRLKEMMLEWGSHPVRVSEPVVSHVREKS